METLIILNEKKNAFKIFLIDDGYCSHNKYAEDINLLAYRDIPRRLKEIC